MAAARLVIRRWPLYLLACAVVIGLEALFYLLVHVKFADLYAELVGGPLVIVVVTVYAGCDARGALLSPAQRWGRIVERAWAIIIIDVGLSFVDTIGFASMQAGDLGSLLMGTMVLFLGAMLVYAEPYACLDDQVHTLRQTITVVPFAILRSMMLAWVNMSRIFLLFALELGVMIAQAYVHQGALHLMRNATWIDFAFATAVNVPVGALFAVAYLDTLSQERQMVAP